MNKAARALRGIYGWLPIKSTANKIDTMPLYLQSLFTAKGPEDRTRNLTLTFALIALGARLAAADKQITPREFVVFRETFPIPGQAHEKTEHLFFMAVSDANPVSHYLRQLLRIMPPDRRLAEDLVRRFCKIAEADGRATLSERRMLEEIAGLLKVEKQVIYTTLSSSFGGGTQVTPYAVLGVSASVSNDALKEAYRARVRSLHPDKMTSEGYSPEDIADAQQELMAVNEAYEMLCRKRKIK